MTIPGADRVDPGAAVAPLDRRGLDAQLVGPLGDPVGGARVRYRLLAQEGQLAEFVGRRPGQRLVLRRVERREHVASHARDDQAGSAGGDHAPELLEHERRADQVDGQNRRRRRLHRRDTRGVHHVDDLAEGGGRLRQGVHRLARGHINRARLDQVARRLQRLGGRRERLVVAVGEQDRPTRPLAAGNRLADPARADDETTPLSFMVVVSPRP